MDSLQPTAIAQAFFCGATGLLLLSLLAKVLRIRAGQLFCLEAFVVGYLLRLGLLFLNEYYQFFEHKVAGNRSVEFYLNYVAGKGELINLVKDQFAPQVVFNIPFFVMFGASLLTVTISNTFISALTAPLIGLLLHNPFGDRIARRGMMLFFIYPGSVNFALFGLRDPFIFLGMAIFGVTAVTVYAGYSVRLYAFISTIACILMLALRPEMSYVAAALIGLLILPWLQRVIAPEQRPIEKFALVGFLTISIIALSLPLAVVSLKIAALQIGSDSINPLDFAGQRAEERFARAESMGMGGGTHCVSAENYAALPIYLRVPLHARSQFA